MQETATKPAETRSTTTAEDTLKRKSRDAGLISGGHLVARALKNEGVDTIFTLCGGHIIDISSWRTSMLRMPSSMQPS